MARVLVTGAFGYIGLAVTRALARDHEVTAFGHAPRNEAAAALLDRRVERVFGDILEVGEVLRRRGPFDAVAHLAGGGGPAKIQADIVGAVRANLRGTTELAASARTAGVRRLVFASTIAVYGTSRDHGRPYRESDAASPDEPYGALKEAAEHAWVALGGGCSLRLANVYGSGIGVDMGLQGAVERFARAAATDGEISIFGSGEQRIDYVHVEDVARAFALAVEAESVPPYVNVGGGSPIAIGDLAERCAEKGRALGRAPRLVRKPAPPGKSWPDRSLDVGLAKSTLGWEPSTSYDQGLAELVRMMLLEEKRG